MTLRDQIIELVEIINVELSNVIAAKKQLDLDYKVVLDENEKLKEQIGLRLSLQNAVDVKHDIRRSFDLAWSETMGEESFPMLKKHFKERLGI